MGDHHGRFLRHLSSWLADSHLLAVCSHTEKEKQNQLLAVAFPNNTHSILRDPSLGACQMLIASPRLEVQIPSHWNWSWGEGDSSIHSKLKNLRIKEFR